MKKDFVVNVNLRTTGVTERGFGTILILDHEKEAPYTLYNNISELEGYSPDSKVYKIASRIFGQNPAPQQVAIAGTVTV